MPYDDTIPALAVRVYAIGMCVCWRSGFVWLVVKKEEVDIWEENSVGLIRLRTTEDNIAKHGHTIDGSLQSWSTNYKMVNVAYQ